MLLIIAAINIITITDMKNKNFNSISKNYFALFELINHNYDEGVFNNLIQFKRGDEHGG